MSRSPSAKPSPQLDTRVIYCGDNLDQLRKLPEKCVDLIYIDPPFNSNRNYEVFWGETKEKRAFEDRHASTQAYIEFMRPRCVELARVLKDTGSFYYHCDWHASHYVKVMLDQIFGENSFINEIVWAYESGGRAAHHFHRKHDILLLYSPTAEKQSYTFNGLAAARPRNECDACGTVLEKWNNLKREVDKDGRVFRTIRGAGGKIYRYYDDEPVSPLDAFCGCGTALVAAQKFKRQWIGIDISPTACRVMANRLKRICGLREDEKAWREGRGFIVRDLPWTENQLRTIPPFEFENWAVIALGGIPNKVQVGDFGIDGKIFPVSVTPERKDKTTGHLDFMDVWYPVQVKQRDKVGRPDIDSFEAMMTRENRTKGFFVSFDYSRDALTEVDRFFKQTGKVIVPLTVKEILDEEIARKLA